VVTLDVGDAGDIHPKKKLPVAERLIKAAASLENGVVVGQISPNMIAHRAVYGGRIIEIELSEPVSTPCGESPVGVAVLGSNGHWHWGEVRIVNSSLHVSSPMGEFPTAVRYAWDDDPTANLFAASGLPLAPFRTDE
jgi:sialate O-acetylesterase